MKYFLLSLFIFAGCTPRYMVRECGVLVGGHSAIQSFGWVQPCDRSDGVSGVDGDLEGCATHCRPAKTACEKDQAMFRDPKIWSLSLKYCLECNTHEGRVTRTKIGMQKLDEIMNNMDVDCKEYLPKEHKSAEHLLSPKSSEFTEPDLGGGE